MSYEVNLGDIDTPNDPRERLISLRSRMGITQTAFAVLMGTPLRTLQDIEAGRNPVRPIHIKAAERAAFDLARDFPDKAKALPQHLKDVLTIGAKNI